VFCGVETKLLDVKKPFRLGTKKLGDGEIMVI
jgi:hypothetical protein